MSDYLGGTRLTLVTDLAPHEVSGRINETVRTAFRNRGAVASGWSGGGRLYLWHRARPIGSAGDRLLAGRIKALGRGSVLDLHYRVPWPIAVIAAAIGLALAGYALWAIFGRGSVFLLLAYAGMSLLALAYLFPGKENEAREMGNLVNFLRETLDARDPGAAPAQE